MNNPAIPVRPLVRTTLRPIHADCHEVRHALAKLAEDDPTFKVENEEKDGQIVIGAMGELHLEIICDRLRREYNIHVEAAAPTIVYVETVSKPSEGDGEFISQSGVTSQYAHVVVRIEPNPGKGHELVDIMPLGSVPAKYVKPIKQGIQYALEAGVVAGYEVVDVRVTLCDGSYHETDSDEGAFETAGFMAAKEAIAQGSPVLLEPVMSLEVVVPGEFTGSVIANLNSRRGRIEAMEHRAEAETIRASVPLAEMFGYAADLRSSTQGRAIYSLGFAGYEQTPGRPLDGDDRIGVTANKPWKPKPKCGAEAVEPPPDLDC